MVEKKRRRRRSRSRKKKSGFSFGKIALAVFALLIVLASANKFMQSDEQLEQEKLIDFKNSALFAGKQLLRESLDSHSARARQVYLIKGDKDQWSLNGALEYINSKISNPFHVELIQQCEQVSETECWSLGKVIVDGKKYRNFFEALRVAKSDSEVEQLSDSTFLLSKDQEKLKKSDQKIKSEFSFLKYRKKVDVSFRNDLGRKYKKIKQYKSYSPQGLSYIPKKLNEGVPFKLIRGVHPVVEVVVNGNQTLNMLIDTGASRTWVPPEVFSENKNQRQVDLDSLCLSNDLCFEQMKAISKKSNYTQRIIGNYNGLIGMDLLRLTGLTLDYDKKLAYFILPRFMPHYKNATKASFVIDDSGRPFAVMSLGAKVYDKVLLDTGASYTRITPLMQAQTEAIPVPKYNEMAFSIDGLQLTDVGELPDLCLDGEVCRKGVLGQVGSWSAFGATFFRNYISSFDFSKNELALTVSTAEETKSSLEKWGMQLSIHDPSSFAWIFPGGMADKKGVKNSMTIVMVNNVRIEEMGYIGAQNILDTKSEIELTLIDSNREVKTFNFSD
ncbi:hypothetical protein RYZ26_06810 [Terasakiella sp. A23]|uniref:hypothetical protein n=1 Tax=Terasakiella sp. FCG-A23 TaxID=3080561 RepID=UPI0029550738|nr:hypothetical protein [Terasakiella sp. A23]MDV7339297.1 hypothetical protein [Terasakiella sp. A23]